MRFVNRRQMQAIVDAMPDNDYKKYLVEVVAEVDGERD
jgi:hypothetical protein